MSAQSDSRSAASVSAKSSSTPSAHCRALFLAAPASGQGKTTVTAALARLLRRRGKRVRIFKTGPDYLDPQILAQASGAEVAPLDLWMAGEPWCRQQLYVAAQSADIILIEGAMGLFDGEPSSADLAAYFGIPIAVVMDVKGMAQTAAAIAGGLAQFRTDIQFAGLIANHCGSQRHRELISAALPANLPLLFAVPRAQNMVLPERHLGLVQASERAEELEQCFEAGADCLEQAGALALIEAVKPLTFDAPDSAYLLCDWEQAAGEKPLSGVTIAIAKDSAFSFIYPDNVRLLEALGARIAFFSPLCDAAVPAADALWLPGGYPELHAQALSGNSAMLASIKAFFAQGKVILAECGGLLYSLDSLTDLNGVSYPMAGLLPGQGAMTGKRGCQGMQTAPLPEGDVRGHAHHRSRSSVRLAPIAHGRRQRHGAAGEAVYRYKNLTASYLHLFFPSNPQAIAALFQGGVNCCLHAETPACGLRTV
ncbi:MAG: cobyrinate a,c-diamide synthase [Cellvibrionaceae bacterium]|nr:cobyrinate a,c-diamide synthase [Cellvibrionaceae bacterium]